MRRLAVNLLLFAMLLGITGFQLEVRPQPARTNFEFLPQMVHSPRYNAFALNPNFPDGQTLQALPPGAIPRGYLPLHYAATPQDALRAGEELTSPAAYNNQRAVQRGQAVFKSFCTPCHGLGGMGDGPVTRKGFPPPPALLAEHATKLKDGQMFHILTYGQNNMPSHAAQLERADRWDVIAYVRTLQAVSPSQPAPVAAPLPKAARANRAQAAGGGQR